MDHQRIEAEVAEDGRTVVPKRGATRRLEAPNEVTAMAKDEDYMFHRRLTDLREPY